MKTTLLKLLSARLINDTYSNYVRYTCFSKKAAMSTFLSDADVAMLTGRKKKDFQREQLMKMGIPFFVNACGRPVVARSFIDGKEDIKAQPQKRWEPPVLHSVQ